MPTLSFADSSATLSVFSRTIRIILTKPVAPFDARNFDCQNCSVSNVRADGSAPNTYLATVNPSSRDQAFTVLVRSSPTSSRIARSNTLEFGPQEFTRITLKGASILSNPNQPVSIVQRRFVPSESLDGYFAFYYKLLKSYPTSDLNGVLGTYGGYSSNILEFKLDSPGENNQNPCFDLWLIGRELSGPPDFQAGNTGKIYNASGCETLVANNSGGVANSRVLRGLFNAPYGTAGERPIDVEYSVVNSNPVAGDISQQVFPPYTVAALNFNSAGAAQRDFQTTGPAPCFLVKWRFSFPNGVYSPPEIRQFCQGGPTDTALYQD